MQHVCNGTENKASIQLTPGSKSGSVDVPEPGRYDKGALTNQHYESAVVKPDRPTIHKRNAEYAGAMSVTK